METGRAIQNRRTLTASPADMTAVKPELSIVLPVYNESLGIPKLLQRLDGFLGASKDLKAEVLFVDDHSTDGSGELLRTACDGNPVYRYLRLARNSGPGSFIFKRRPSRTSSRRS